MTVGAVDSLDELARLCLALGVSRSDLTDAEVALIDGLSDDPFDEKTVRSTREAILAGHDPLGSAYTRILSPVERRPLGQTYTPEPIIASMVKWAFDQGNPVRIVDPGAGSGRYLMAAAEAFPKADLVALEIDPMTALMLRANLQTTGLAERATVMVGDYRAARLPKVEGATLYIGNPPYVRHHEISEKWKKWLTLAAASFGLRASQLAGLHIHFFMATAHHAQPGDYGAFITSSEWLDVNYGSVLRQLLLAELGGTELHILEPELAPFADATTTGAITCFVVGQSSDRMLLRRVPYVADLGRLGVGREIARERLAESNRWSVLTRTGTKTPEGYIELGELCRVHRGTVTGANRVWVTKPGAVDLPEEVLFPSVTKAKELFQAGERLTKDGVLKSVIDLPTDLDALDDEARKLVEKFLRVLKREKVHQGYVASARRAWWSVGLRLPAPILATYMARRPPAFVRNDADARHINIAHGLYPRQELSTTALDNLAAHLNGRVSLESGRVYAGGLTKFEPKEMERLPVPTLEELEKKVRV